MFEYIYNAEATAGFRRCAFSLRNTADDTPYVGAIPGGTKAHLSLNCAAQAASTNDIVRLDATNLPGAVYLELTASELAAYVKGNLVGSVSGIAGVKTEDFQCTIVPYDPWSVAAPDVNLAKINGHTVIGDGSTSPFDVT